VHIVGPEQGITQPGTTIACGDSHTSTHGAFGAIAFGIGTSQVRDVLATQTMALGQLKVRRIEVNGKLRAASTPRTSFSTIIRQLGVNGGTGFAYEYAGSTFDALLHGRSGMTVCNMSIEGGARVGYVNPDETTFAYLKGRPYSPTGTAWDTAVAKLEVFRLRCGAHYDDVVKIDAASIAPTVTWGINPGQGISIIENIRAGRRRRSSGCDRQAGIIEPSPTMKLPAAKPTRARRSRRLPRLLMFSMMEMPWPGLIPQVTVGAIEAASILDDVVVVCARIGGERLPVCDRGVPGGAGGRVGPALQVGERGLVRV